MDKVNNCSQYTKLICSLDEQQCQQECEHKENRSLCPRTQKRKMWDDNDDRINDYLPDCSQHKKEVAGILDMKVLAEMIGDLHYETLAEFLNSLAAC